MTERSWHLFTEGWLSGWWGVCLLAVAAGFAIYQVKREFAQGREQALTRWLLPALRFTIIGLFVWLLCRPALRVTTRQSLEQELLILIDSGRSMQVREGFGSRSRLLDVVETLQQPIPGRVRFGSQLAAATADVVERLHREFAGWQKRLAAAEMGLPLGEESRDDLLVFGPQLLPLVERVQDASAPAQVPIEDQGLLAALAAVQTQQQAFCATAAAIANESELIWREASESLPLLPQFVDHLGAAATAAQQLLKDAQALQEQLDGVALPAAQKQSLRALRQTRREFALLASKRVASQQRYSEGVELQMVPDLISAMRLLQRHQEVRPHTAALLVSDGGAGAVDEQGRVARRLAAMGVPVHTILTGRDKTAPADGGLVAVELPAILVQHEETRVRVLVKWEFPSPRAGALEIHGGSSRLARQEIGADHQGYQVLTIPFVPTVVGRQQLVFQLSMAQADDYPGNEVQVRTTHVLSTPVPVLLVGSSVNDDFAAYQEVLGQMPGVSLQMLLGVPGLSRLKIGSEAGAWPAKAQAWRGIGMAVLIGAIPEDLRKDPQEAAAWMGGLRTAVEEGLAVFIHEPEALPAAHSWTQVLELKLQGSEVSGPLHPTPGLWLDAHRLGRDMAASLDRWASFGTVSSRSLVSGIGLPLLQVGDDAGVSLLQRGKGRLLFCGLPQLKTLRERTGLLVNRLLAGLLVQALLPHEGIVPVQPVAGYDLYSSPAGALTASPASLQPQQGAPTGWERWRVKAARSGPAELVPQLSFTLDGQEQSLFVDIPYERGDFELQARAAPLRELAERTGGTFHPLHELADWQGPEAGPPVVQEHTTHHSLWRGSWVLAVLLLLVSAEYLLRRRAGRVM